MYSHKELVLKAETWLKGKCGCVVRELVTIAGEQPDVFGFRSDSTWLIECKTSRADFFADKKKNFRANPFLGVGDFRFYFAPKGLIKIEELPTLWGLIEVDEKGKCLMAHNPFGIGNRYYSWTKHEKSAQNEYYLIYSILRRIQLRGHIESIYEKPYENKIENAATNEPIN